MSTRRNILMTKIFFLSSAGKIESVQEFKMKLFEWMFHCRWQSCKNCIATCSKHDSSHFRDNFHLSKYYPVKVRQICFCSFNYSNQTGMQVSKYLFVLDK